MTKVERAVINIRKRGDEANHAAIVHELLQTKGRKTKKLNQREIEIAARVNARIDVTARKAEQMSDDDSIVVMEEATHIHTNQCFDFPSDPTGRYTECPLCGRVYCDHLPAERNDLVLVCKLDGIVGSGVVGADPTKVMQRAHD